MNRLLQLCPMKIFSIKAQSIFLGQSTTSKAIRDFQPLSSICQQKRKQSAKVALLKLALKKKKPKRKNEVLRDTSYSNNVIGAQVRPLNSTHFSSREMNDITLPIDPSCDTQILDEEILERNIKMKEKENSLNSNQAVKKKNKKTEQKAELEHLISEKEALAKTTALNETLLAYIDACVNCEFLKRGLTTLKHYMAPKQLKKAQITNIEIFNTLLHAYAGQGKLDKVREIVGIIDQHDFLHPNIDTFAAQFECLGRKSSKHKYTEQIADLEIKMNSVGFKVNDMFVQCNFVQDQRDAVLNAVKQVHPLFTPAITLPNLFYTCNLLTELNQSKKPWLTPASQLLLQDKLKEAASNQIETEIQGVVSIDSINVVDHEDHHKVDHYRQILELTKDKWRSTIRKALERDLNIIKSQHNKLKTYRSVNIYPFLRVLSIQDYSDIILNEVLKLVQGSDYFSPTLSHLHKNLGRQVYNRYSLNKKKNSSVLEKQVELYKKYCDWYIDPKDNRIQNTRQAWQILLHEHTDGASLNKLDIEWPWSVLSSVGKFLYNIIVKDIKIDINLMKTNKHNVERMLPAFYTIYRMGRHMNEEIKPHPVLTKLYRATYPEKLTFEAIHCPMKSPPLPWNCVNKGGYILAQVPFIRLPPQAQQQQIKLQNMNQQQLYPAFDSLNQLGSTPWVVNDAVLEVITHVFQNGGSTKLDIPKPSSSFPLPPTVTHTMSHKEKHEAFRERFLLKRQKSEMFSLWCDTLYRLSLAHHFKGKIFWLPHNMDFRGRVYPCPPHLNHLGSDMARSMLQFAKLEPLGPEGLNWLKIHCINLTGLKKKDAISERLRYANSMINDILDSAQNPLSGRMWWADSENPWQTLACCIEIKKAVDSDNPAEYLSGFPIHQDGSCNGLQHYAALGRDHDGAVSVNLTPSERPQDVYSAVANLVEQERAKDAQNGVTIAQIMDGFVLRKVIKQTVMTTVYGVTRYGARLQIAKQLKDLDAYPQEHVWAGSSYLMLKTFECLRAMFTSTREIQDWFTECAKYITAVKGKNVEWVTPLGLPVIQHYHKVSKSAKETPKLAVISRNVASDMFNKPNMMKQKNAFPPNFVHSLDSTHMMLTSLFCENAGITYVSVHDCFWTHPRTVHIMNKICRQQFVNLHSQPILEDLSVQLINNYSCLESEIEASKKKDKEMKLKLNEILKQVPPKGDFNIRQVLKSVYFFS